jgi:hypothetical protein
MMVHNHRLRRPAFFQARRGNLWVKEDARLAK